MDDQIAASTLSAYFEDKIKTIMDSFSDSVATVEQTSDLFCGTPLSNFQPVTEDELLKLVRRCRPTTSVDDPIPTSVLLQHLDILLPVLVRIVNASLFSASVPRQFKTAVIKPILKKHNLDPSSCKNYRPVSNLPFVSKLVERVVAHQLTFHLDRYSLLDKFQSAYRPKHSCETALLRLMNDLLCSADAGKVTLVVLLDLSAAFDVIDHSTLLTRLQMEVGIGGSALQWFHSYLSDRTQRVMVNQASSVTVPLLCGVPQGSVLGPVYFLFTHLSLVLSLRSIM
ncbi:hypothetical protein C0Q70_19956 [Pomacea canaliculata]|uniref:Reverse transcriptase domain-containing protein n=1 Tax=Pomacea canaliculata TaxID=400727 RepID=A0A2T7NE71_POMCA|nr:hypothetical protein C0Q70_19956 [Pomacea canaliculata]